MKNNIMLRVEGVSVSYGPVKAVDSASIEVHEGEIVVLIGANGAGKTTLLRSILGVDKAQSGRVFLLGEDITGKSTDAVAKSGIGLIPEGHLVFSSMTVMENLQLGGYHNPRDIESNLETVFESFPVLRRRLDQTAGTLSGGEQQMLSIARTLMSRPKLIMADEPSLGLAPRVVSEIFDILRDLNKKGYTILLAEQNAKKALEFGNRGYVMETGRVVLEGPTQELMSNPQVRHAYLGSNV